MSKISSRYINFEGVGEEVIKDFAPSITDGQTVTVYLEEEMAPYSILGENISPNLLESPELFLDYSAVTLRSSGATATVTASYLGTGILTAISSNTDVAVVSVNGKSITITAIAQGNASINVTLSEDENYNSAVKAISINVLGPLRYGIKIDKNESDPDARVTYLFDAEGMTPAHMDYTTGEFNYGSWKNAWFVANNKPCMLKGDGTVDYYLKEDDYTLRADGKTESDVEDTSYDGNAMAQIPLCYVCRYEDENYEYEIVSNIPFDSNYKAYAHTRADGTIANYFYWSMFGASGSATKMRSIKNQILPQKLSVTDQIAGAQANGSNWYIHSWSQKELIRTLLCIMAKTTDLQTAFGNGNFGKNATNYFATGTFYDKGQFWGSSESNQQVKTFHIEAFWGEQFDRTAGLINNKGQIYVKMTPEGNGYQIDNVEGYTDTGINLSTTSPSVKEGYIKECSCSEYGIIPKNFEGSKTTYYCDLGRYDVSALCYLITSYSVGRAVGDGGGFAFVMNLSVSSTGPNYGCGLSCEMPAV